MPPASRGWSGPEVAAGAPLVAAVFAWLHLLAAGIAAALLMAEYCRRCDEAGLPGYLETIRSADPSRRAQERLYERHGFAVAEVVPGG